MFFKIPPKLGSKEAIEKYLQADLWSWLKEAYVGLSKINFVENFECFRIDNLLIPNGVQVTIPNKFQNTPTNVIPSSRLIVRQQATGAIGNTGNGFITDGLTPWNTKEVYLFNHGPEDTIVSVIFFK